MQDRAAQYSERATKIKAIVDMLLARWNMAKKGTLSDKYAVIKIITEVINKLLYSFLVSEQMYEEIESKLNNEILKLEPNTDSVNTAFALVRDVLEEFDKIIVAWQEKYSEDEPDDE